MAIPWLIATQITAATMESGYEFLRALQSEDEFTDFKDDVMCCSSIYSTRHQNQCSICCGLHVMTLRRLRCVSPTCHPLVMDNEWGESFDESTRCQVEWKVKTCSTTGVVHVFINRVSHARRALPCGASHAPRITPAMKAFLRIQDECGFPPRVMLVNMINIPTIPMPRYGWPSINQVNNALKTIRRSAGAKNSVAAIQEYVKLYPYVPEINVSDAFLFGPSVD